MIGAKSSQTHSFFCAVFSAMSPSLFQTSVVSRLLCYCMYLKTNAARVSGSCVRGEGIIGPVYSPRQGIQSLSYRRKRLVGVRHTAFSKLPLKSEILAGGADGSYAPLPLYV